jgi:transcriptional regulator GlxA family with amidase domain
VTRLRRIVIVGFEGVQPLDVTGPHEVFAGANAYPGGPRYELALVATTPIVRSESGLGLVAGELGEGRVDTLVLPGGDGVFAAAADEATLDLVRRAARGARRIATVCTGTFLAAGAGLIDHHRVTTHWARAERLAREHPALDVDPDPVYRRDGNVWSSAGVTAGIDLALALVEDDHGVEIAQTIARWLVMFLHRPGGQSQFAAPVWVRRAEHDAVRRAQSLVDADPAADHRVGVLAARVAMSERHFLRLFTAEVGTSPAKYVAMVRVEAARRALEESDATVEAIARQVGFGSSETMRRAFGRRLGVSPDDYRRRFHTHPAA